MDKSLEIFWYGRCCFLVKYGDKSVLFDPYDIYHWNIDMGTVVSDTLLISSTWHDHGHIGASPTAHVFSYPGEYERNGIKIVGIKAKEDRGTPNVIFNVKMGPYSITNFADFGPEQKEDFDKNLTSTNKKVLQSTNIAFIRPSIERERENERNVHNECALDYCEPSIIFPEHYFPRSFIEEQVPEEKKSEFLSPNVMVDEMIELFKYPLKEIDDYKLAVTEEDMKNKKFARFLKLHNQVKYNKE